jgi:hypothetical protein
MRCEALGRGVAALLLVLVSTFASANDTDINRQPGCLREQLFVNETIAKVHRDGAPVGAKIMGPGTSQPLNDPAYPGWNKYQHSVIEREFVQGAGYVTRWQMVVHYMYNPANGVTAQVKLKNTHASGCQGQISPVGEVSDSGGAGGGGSNPGIGASVDLSISGAWIYTYMWDHYYGTVKLVDLSFEPSGFIKYNDPPPIYYQEVER